MIRYLSTTIKYTIVKLVDILFEEIFLRYEALEDIITNRSSLFTSDY